LKVTIDPKTGEITFDIAAGSSEEVEQAVAFARRLQNGSAPARPEPIKKEPAIPVDRSREEEWVMSSIPIREQAETWLYLRRNDRVTGVPVAALARRCNISGSAASARCRTLVKTGYAVCIRKGWYRAVIPGSKN